MLVNLSNANPIHVLRMFYVCPMYAHCMVLQNPKALGNASSAMTYKTEPIDLKNENRQETSLICGGVTVSNVCINLPRLYPKPFSYDTSTPPLPHPDPTPTPPRPHLDPTPTPTSTPPRPHPDPTSTPPRPHPDPTPTPPRPHLDPTSTPPRPHLDTTQTPPRPLPHLDPTPPRPRPHLDPTSTPAVGHAHKVSGEATRRSRSERRFE